MTRISKQAERRSRSPRKRHYKIQNLTGAKKDQLPDGYRVHPNAITQESQAFIGKVK